MPVIRLGLQAQDNLSSDGDIAAGEYQSAIGVMVDGAIYLELLCEKLDKYTSDELKCAFLNVECTVGASSAVAGINKENKRILLEKYGLYKIKITEKEAMKPFEISIRVVADVRRGSRCI